MARWGRVDLKRLQRLQEKIEKLEQADFALFAERSAKMLAARLLAKVSRRTPVDSGRLRQGWTTGSVDGSNNMQVKKSGDIYEIVVSNGLNYANFVEFGHRVRGNNSFVPGRFMLTISTQEVEEQAEALIKRELDKLLGEVFGGN